MVHQRRDHPASVLSWTISFWEHPLCPSSYSTRVGERASFLHQGRLKDQSSLQRIQRACRERSAWWQVDKRSDVPLWFDFRYCSDIWPGREHKLIEENPFGLRV